MKIKYIIAITIAFSLFSCKKQEPPFFDKNSNGVYFDVEGENDAKQEYNFNKNILDTKPYTEFDIPIKVLGYISDKDRKIKITTTPVEGYDLLNVEMPKEIVVKKGTYNYTLVVLAPRPKDLQKKYAVKLQIDSTGLNQDFGAGIRNKHHYTLFVEETYNDTEWKASPILTKYFGEWTSDKFRFLVNLSGKQTLDFSKTELPKYVIKSIDSVRSYNALHPEAPYNFGIPFYKEVSYSKLIKFTKPLYWNENIKNYLGDYRYDVFTQIAKEHNIDTQNEDNLIGKASDEQLKSYNKTAYNYMIRLMNYHYKVDDSCPLELLNTVPFINDIDYDLQVPSIWNDAAQILNKYYGEPSKEKFNFMVKTIMKYKIEQGHNNFNIIALFPIEKNNGEVSLYEINANDENNTDEDRQIIANYTYNTTVEGLSDFNKILRKADTNNVYNFPTIQD